MKQETKKSFWTPMRRSMICYTAMIYIWLPSSLFALEKDLIDLSIEELMDVKVTSVSKKLQNLADSATAIFVITNEDLKRSGVTNIPDALRMVPGLNVSRIDSNKWAVNSREVNSRFANKLLVLIDGRSVYTNSFSGVYWEVQDQMLEDIDRIEVIRGPGATLWGANAVNGVINIISKHAADTQGGFVDLRAGTKEQGFAGTRFGLSLGDVTYGRLYAKIFERGEFEHEDGGDAGDDWKMVRGGFRLDSHITPKNSITAQVDIYQGEIHQDLLMDSLISPYYSQQADTAEVSGGNLLVRWHRVVSASSEWTLQTYYDRTKRLENYLEEVRDNFDLEIQHRWLAFSRHDIVWGGRYCYSHDDFIESYAVSIDLDSRSDNLFSGFLQDEITLVDERLWFTLGSKVEYNDYSGFEIQPSARLIWAPKRQHRVWGAVSRAVRTPSRLEHDSRLVTKVVPPTPSSFGLPVEGRYVSDRNYDSEVLLAYELGYRYALADRLSLDITTFFFDYNDVRNATERQPIIHGNYLEIPLVFDNSLSAQAYGMELAVSFKATDWLQFDLAYSYLDSDLDELNENMDEPTYQLSLRSALIIGQDFNLDFWIRYVDQTNGIFTFDEDNCYEIDDYITGDLRLAWRPNKNLEVSLVGQNLFDETHMEYIQEKFTLPTEVVRSVYGKLAYHF